MVEGVSKGFYTKSGLLKPFHCRKDLDLLQLCKAYVKGSPE